MDFETKHITSDIKISEFKGDRYKTEHAFSEHLLAWLLAGETRVVLGESTVNFVAGDVFLIPQYQVATFINSSSNGQRHKAVAMLLGPERLKAYYAQHAPSNSLRREESILRFGKHPLLESCLVSLIPYFEVKDPFPEEIASLKIIEAISVLRVVDPGIDGILSNFEEPGKLPLVEYMEKHFMYNLPLEKFGYLTGRSLSTFNRDFRKAFQETPQRWLTRKRLELAHYRMKESRMRPAEVFMEVGFEDLSHFSFAFKKHFGYAPGSMELS